MLVQLELPANLVSLEILVCLEKEERMGTVDLKVPLECLVHRELKDLLVDKAP